MKLNCLPLTINRIVSHHIVELSNFNKYQEKKKTPRNFQLFILQANLTEHRAGIASKSYYLCTIP